MSSTDSVACNRIQRNPDLLGNGNAALEPRLKTAVERSNVIDALLSLRKGDARAREITQASTIEEDLPWTFCVTALPRPPGIDANCARYRHQFGWMINRVLQVNN
jgi:hypothetical protein